MKNLTSIAKPVSWASLLLIVLPPILFFNGGISHGTMNLLLLVGTFIWFASASLWMKSE